MIPTLRLVVLAALGVPLALVAMFGPEALLPFLALDVALVGAVVADRALAADPRRLDVRRELPARCVQGSPAEVRLEVAWPGPRAARFVLRDVPPAGFDVETARFDVALPPSGRAGIAYAATPRERGSTSFGPCAVRSRGPLGLVERQTVVSLPAATRVFPDMVRLSAREAALMHPARWAAGRRRGSSVGEGREFHELRPYVAGDDLRLVDWKSYARHGAPAVRTFRAERNQRVLLLIDGGRRMTARVGDRLRFDWAVQAAGRLGRVALAGGDLVGLAVYSARVRAHVAPARGAGQLAALAEMLGVVMPDLDEPHLGRALRTLLPGQARRTLVVVFTDVGEPRAAEAVLREVGALAPRHLGLVVTLADLDLERERDRPVRTADDAWLRLAADELTQEIRKVELGLEARGARWVRARADALAAETVERYVEIKARGRL